MTLKYLPPKIKKIIEDNNIGSVLYREEDINPKKTENNLLHKELPRQFEKQYVHNLNWQIILINKKQESFIVGITLILKSDSIVIGYRLSEFYYQNLQNELKNKAIEKLYEDISKFYNS